jgi:hypothetical protein
MRIAALLLALFIVVTSLVGIVATDSAMTVRRMYYATPGRFYAAGAVRIMMGLVLIVTASRARWPRTLRALGAVMCLQAITANILGIERARAIMEWEVMQGNAILRAGAVVALASGLFVAYAFSGRPSWASRARLVCNR